VNYLPLVMNIFYAYDIYIRHFWQPRGV